MKAATVSGGNFSCIYECFSKKNAFHCILWFCGPSSSKSWDNCIFQTKNQQWKKIIHEWMFQRYLIKNMNERRCVDLYPLQEIRSKIITIISTFRFVIKSIKFVLGWFLQGKIIECMHVYWVSIDWCWMIGLLVTSKFFYMIILIIWVFPIVSFLNSGQQVANFCLRAYVSSKAALAGVTEVK